MLPGRAGRRLTFDVMYGKASPDAGWQVYCLPSQRAGSMPYEAPCFGGEPEQVMLSAGEDFGPKSLATGTKLIYANTRSNYPCNYGPSDRETWRRMNRGRSSIRPSHRRETESCFSEPRLKVTSTNSS